MMPMQTLEEIKKRLESAVPGVCVEIVSNDSPCQQRSLLIDRDHGPQVAAWLRRDDALRLDYLSNVTGVDWPEVVTKQKIKVKRKVDGVEKEVEEVVQTRSGGYLEAVYHLYSMELKQGAVVIRMRTGDRDQQNKLQSLTAIWRSAELQEREIYDLFGIVFEGHPDLRRILMWDGFEAHPMRRDYVEPDDYEYEPTPHDSVLAKAKAHYPPEVAP